MASLPFLVHGTRRSFLANLGYKCLTSPASKSHLNASPIMLQRCTYCIGTNAHGGENHENAVESKLKSLGHVARVLPTPFDTLQMVKELQKAGRKPQLHKVWWHGTRKTACRVCARSSRGAITSSCFGAPTEQPARGAESSHSKRSSEC